MDKLLVLDLVLLSSIALNLAAAGLSLWRARQYINKLKATSEPVYLCARLGHDFEFDMITLDNHQPPQFEWTHLYKWTCKSCDFEERVTQRQVIYAPGVSEIVARWIDRPEDC